MALASPNGWSFYEPCAEWVGTVPPVGAALIWFVVAMAFAAGEVAVAGSFFLLPFAIGAAAGGATALLGGGLTLQILIAVLASAGSAAVLIPYGRRLGQNSDHGGVGANRWVGKEAVVLAEIPGRGEVGRIRVDREEWMAESLTGAPIRIGSTVLVSRVDGTRLVVLPLDEPLPELGEGV